MLQRYYPELAPTTALQRVAFDGQAQFDYGAEMDVTRRRVDALLAEGEVEAAEAFMELRRQLFVRQWLRHSTPEPGLVRLLRRLPVRGAGRGRDDPIGPALRELLARSPTLHDWVVSLRGITTRAQLLDLLAETDQVAA